MVKGGSVGGGPVVGDESRNSARSGDFAAAGEHLLALRIRPLGRSLAPESRAGRWGVGAEDGGGGRCFGRSGGEPAGRGRPKNHPGKREVGGFGGAPPPDPE